MGPSIYTKTPKGILEANTQTVTLSAELRAVLAAVDGKASIAELEARCGIAAPELQSALEKLAADGYVKDISNPEQTAPREASDLERIMHQAVERAHTDLGADDAEAAQRQHATRSKIADADAEARESLVQGLSAADAKVEPPAQAATFKKERVHAERAAHDIIAKAADGRRSAGVPIFRQRSTATQGQRRPDDRHAARLTHRTPGRRIVTGLLLGLLGVVAAAIAWLQFVPLGAYTRMAQQTLSAALGQPSTISAVRYPLFPTPRLVLENVKIGATQGLRVERVEAPVPPFALFTKTLVLDRIHAEGVAIDPAMLGAIPALMAGRGTRASHVRDVRLSRVSVNAPGANIAPMNGNVSFAANGAVLQAILKNETVTVNLRPQQNGVRVTLNAREWRAPYGPPVQFSFLTLEGVADTRQFAAAEISGQIAGGAVKATLSARWQQHFIMEGDFRLDNVRLQDLQPPLTALRGALSASGRYSTRAEPASEGADTRVDATFSVTGGEIFSVDLMRALQSAGMAKGGGSTRFDALTGSAHVSRGHYAFRQLQLASGPLGGTGSVDLAPNGELKGYVHMFFAVPGAQTTRLALNVTGTAKEPQLTR